MGLSNYYPSSRLSQAGVCTSSTRPASPYEGQMIYETDTNRVLVYDNTAWVMIADTDSPPALELVKTATIPANSSEITVSNAFSDTYHAYKCIISNLSCSSAAQLFMNLDGATTNSYYWGVPLVELSTGSFTSNRGNGTAYVDLGAINNGRVNAFTFDIINPKLSAATSFVGFSYQNGIGFGGVGSGLHNVATGYTGIRFYPNYGTLSGGTICIYGYRQ